MNDQKTNKPKLSHPVLTHVLAGIVGFVGYKESSQAAILQADNLIAMLDNEAFERESEGKS